MDGVQGNRTFIGGRGRGRGRGRSQNTDEKTSNGPLWVHSGFAGKEAMSSKSTSTPQTSHGSKPVKENVHNVPHTDTKSSKHVVMEEQSHPKVSSRMEQMKKQREIAAKYAAIVDDDDPIEERELQDEEILKTTFSSYQETVKGEQPCFSTQHLIDLLQDGATTCIICYETVRHEDAIWSCVQCYCIFHIQCIQKWCKEGLAVKNLYNDDVQAERTIWCCPKCRRDYDRSECPEQYRCFCGKQHDPKFDPWCVPHSCGKQCGKRLQPDCGHDCLLLCHPGPCPPCPKMVSSKCHCGQAKPMVKRCSAKEWSCGAVCSQPLSCGHHLCPVYCHPGSCPSCPQRSEQYCQCRKQKEQRECAEPYWQCKEACGKVLPCGNHICERICHSGVCGECPRSGIRSCPCGKTNVALPCTEDTPTCEDTCNKLLACNRHYCIRKCHFGPCETCRQVLTKRCRCGRREKEVPCCIEYTCDFKCNNMRACGRHGCKRKCCDGNCPSCEQSCNRTLNCRNHKCPAQCHQGSCYPCPLKKEVKCFCGKTVLTVACGKEKTIRPPKCSRLCRLPPSCHHKESVPHKCHYGPCPVCRQICNIPLNGCVHLCLESCHDHIPADNKKKPQVGLRRAWEKVEEEVFVPIPCPPCQTLVSRTCNGKHETIEIPCSEDKQYSCKRECGRTLACGNHQCSKECHVVKDAENDDTAGRNCRKCAEFCQRPRPEGCIHDCKLKCHPDTCPDCHAIVRKQCHCGLIMLYLKCCEITQAEDMTALLSCKSRCSKFLSCGHQCPAVCHQGACVKADACEEKTKIFCPCRRKRRDFPCCKVKLGECVLDCDEKCQELKSKQEKNNYEKEVARKEAEQKREQEELEQFERKKQGRRRKPRKQTEEAVSLSFFDVYRWVIFGIVFGIMGTFVMAVLTFTAMNKT